MPCGRPTGTAPSWAVPPIATMARATIATVTGMLV